VTIGAFQASNSEASAHDLIRAGAEILSGPVTTPWGDRNVRLLGLDGIQLTLFTASVE
jgi:hypothetical protein